MVANKEAKYFVVASLLPFYKTLAYSSIRLQKGTYIRYLEKSQRRRPIRHLYMKTQRSPQECHPIASSSKCR